MSKQTKKPAELAAKKVKNINLLPQVFVTEPNKKMLDSSLDLMTSKGQLSNFKETLGLRTATNSINEFFSVDSDEVRRESQSNNMLVMRDEQDSYIGKTSYLDIENYFRVKGLELKDGIQLDKDINVLDLPIISARLSDYHLYYWVANDLPPMQFHLEQSDTGGNKFSIVNDLLGKPTAILTDDLTGKSVTLLPGMVVYFTGAIDTAYKTDNLDDPKTYFVLGVGESISLLRTTAIDKRIPNSYLKKRPWDKSDPLVDAPAVKWDSEVWDGSQIVTSEPEYITIDKYIANENHWGVIDHWYPISTIKTVADFLGVAITAIVTNANKAKRPIITFNRTIRLYNWPNNIRTSVATILTGVASDYTGKAGISDLYGYTLVNGDRVVFENSPQIYTVSTPATSASFSPIQNIAVSSGDGVIVTVDSNIRYYRLLYKNNKWQFAQNKTKKNQCPRFEFYTSGSVDLETFNEIDYAGGIILDFAQGAVYDYILDRSIQVSSIDFDIINENNSLNISPNQLKFTTDIDKTFSYNEITTGEEIKLKGPFGFKTTLPKLVSFYQPRRGLDITKQTQDLLYNDDSETEWSEEIIPTTTGFNTIHIFYDEDEKLKFYFNLDGHGLVRFSSKRGVHILEQVMPLVADSLFKVVCHDLPYAITFYRTEVIDNISRPVLLEEPYCTNNGVSNGVIELDLSASIFVAGEFIDNLLNIDTTRLFWTANNITKSAIIRPINKWRFVQFAYLRDKTNPIYESYDYRISDVTNSDGSLSYYQQLISTPLLDQKSKYGDKICLDSILLNPTSKTAPLSLTTNPLNATLGVMNYYSLYQHTANLKSNTSNTKESLITDAALIVSSLGGGTLLKHNSPVAKAAIVATNLPYDFSEIIIKQGKHYDLFLNKLTYELEQVIDNHNTSAMSSVSILSLALANIFLNQTNNENFWFHSNMMGWGDKINYVESVKTVNQSLIISLSNGLSLINHKAGKETILHIVANNKLLIRDVDYTFESADGYYTAIKFNNQLEGTTVTIRQWVEEFNSKIPASLAKIGLSPVYKPEIYTNGDSTYFLNRHDGTRLYLEDGVDTTNYPINTVEQLLFEYEKAVWSSIARDVESNSNAVLIEDQPGYFRSGRYNWDTARNVVNSEVLSWMAENNIFTMTNATYDENNAFTHIYQLGSGDDDNTMTGSWRAIYKYLYDTDRPHSHPWEMLGHNIKPSWWDLYYSWTDSAKRTTLERALRTGNTSTPLTPKTNPFFARVANISADEMFPVTTTGALLPPSQLDWLNASSLTQDRDWVVGEQGPFETVFLNTHRGLAAEAKLKFLASPARYVNLNWVPGQITVNEWGIQLDSTSKFWQTGNIEHSYHRQVVDGATVYTAGIESLFAEFCALNNKDFKSTVIDKFNNLTVNKEFLLSGFSNKNNIRIESTSIATQSKALFVPEENYAVRLVKHYPNKEVFYSAMRVIWNGSAYSVHGFTNELGLFSYYAPKENSSTSAKTIGNIVVKEKNVYSTDVKLLQYGNEFKNRQELYDVIIGYGKYLEAQGFKFNDVESYDLRNWQLSASQFIFWSNDMLAPGNYIDLNPAASGIILSMSEGQLENLEGTNDNIGQCVDRKNQPLFSNDLLVERGDTVSIKTKDINNPIYGIKLTFAIYESVVHLDSTSVFNDVYFLPDQCTTKRSFVMGGKKSQTWDGKYFVPGYVVSNGSIIPNYDTYAEVGRNLLDIENVIEDPIMLEASRAQFGLNRNPELRQLFLQEETETLFKNAITYTKGTKQIFTGLVSLTHPDASSIKPLEEYMVRIGEMGNTKNIEFYEFELTSNDLSRNPQVISFVNKNDDQSNPNIHYITDNSQKWVHRPFGKQLSFDKLNRTYTNLKTSGPIIEGDTDFSIATLDDLPSLYSNFSALYDIESYATEKSYKKNTLIRYKGFLYYSLTTISPNTWSSNSDKFSRIDEPMLPNIFVANYNKTNPDLLNTGNSMFTPATWQVLQTIDRNIAIDETCAGPTDVSKARITCNIDHHAQAGDYVLIINTTSANATVDGIWKIESVGSARQFFINTRITQAITTGKVFVFKPVRFKNLAELDAATGANADTYGYAWKKKFNPFGVIDTALDLTPSKYDPTYPIAIIDDSTGDVVQAASFDFGNYKVYQLTATDTVQKTVVKTDSLPLDHSSIEHLVIYDYNDNKVTTTLELFDPRKMYLPKAFRNDIDVINRVDPAKYTRTTDEFKSAYASLGWYEEYAGRRWWDTSTCQFSDYESGDVLTRAQYWGTTVDGKLPDIYEWTKSPVHPTQWSKLVESQGTAFGQRASGEVYVDTTSGKNNYHWVEEQDYVNGKTYNVFYFWVKGKDTISAESQAVRIYSTGQLSKILLNPSAAGLAWWAPINSNSIMLKGVENLLNNSSTIVQIKKKLKGEEKHQQWLFVSEANTSETIPQWMHTRLRDSIAGGIHYKATAEYTMHSQSVSYKQSDFVKYTINNIDKFYCCRVNTIGLFNPILWQEIINVEEVTETTFQFDITKNVPDLANLHKYAQLGNSIRPYPQGWFKNVYEARRTFVKKVNQFLLNVDISSLPNWGDILNQTAYHLFDDTYDMTRYWTYTNYQSEDYDDNKEIVLTVAKLAEIYSAYVTVNSYIRVLEDNTIYEKDTDGGFKVVYRAADSINQRGAVKLSDELFDPKGSWDGSKWDQINVPWDFDYCNIFYAIMEALRNNVFVNQYKTNYSKMTCAMFRYVLSEQINVDWLQKSSTIEPINLISSNLNKTNTLRRDDINVFTNFYSSVKSYRDKIRSATVTKRLLENTSITFDETLFIEDIEIPIGVSGERAGDGIII